MFYREREKNPGQIGEREKRAEGRAPKRVCEKSREPRAEERGLSWVDGGCSIEKEKRTQDRIRERDCPGLMADVL